MLYLSFPDVYSNRLLLFRYTLAAYEDCNFLNEIISFDFFVRTPEVTQFIGV